MNYNSVIKYLSDVVNLKLNARQDQRKSNLSEEARKALGIYTVHVIYNKHDSKNLFLFNTLK